MKNIKFILVVAAAVALMAIFAGCGKSGDGSQDDPTPDITPDPIAGILISGVHWAECNVDAPGTFAASAESPGMFYQWNRRMAWPATGDVVGWDATTPDGDVWEAANDPCPAGWRVPTKEEQATLLDADNVTYGRTTLNGVNGGRFTDKVSGASIFLPAAGYRNNATGALECADSYSFYWSSSTGSWALLVSSGGTGQDYNIGSEGFSVRCVRQ